MCRWAGKSRRRLSGARQGACSRAISAASGDLSSRSASCARSVGHQCASDHCSLLFSALSPVTLPMVVIYLVFNHHIVEGIMAGGVK